MTVRKKKMAAMLIRGKRKGGPGEREVSVFCQAIAVVTID